MTKKSFLTTGQNFIFSQDFINVDCTNSQVTGTLPLIASLFLAPGETVEFAMKKIDNSPNQCAVLASGSDLIMGNPSQSVSTPGQVMRFVADNSVSPAQWRTY